ncbi:MAG: N-acetyl-gamma-glutamyl-phosphate reductase [Gammaproteobacteria bacterium]|nr:N-acetyl-gamma-glutamyl-phosphate reductase [Gammaproteobacteria bacterium]|tara:strand:+ start:743 stop:1723 length:981 start_codon:yes stop_codon:yes gene_type:complete
MSLNIGIVGATGYVGEELASIIESREDLSLAFVSSFSHEGKEYKEVYSKTNSKLVLQPIDKMPDNLDYVFFATKHDYSMDYVPEILKKGIKVIDLSADFRLSNEKLWQETYDSKHRADDLLPQAIYGLPEHSAKKIKAANLVAVPGCYPTASILGLLPVIPYLQKNSKIILDAKSGISGAGKSSVENGLEEDIKENFKSYNVGFHRHQPEIKDFLKMEFNLDHEIIFIPHLLPLFRGEYVTLYCEVIQSDLNLYELYESYYEKHKLVRIKEKGETAEIKDVINTFYCDISISYAFQSNTIVVNSTIDNLLKGAASQAIQCLDIMSN